MSAADSGGFRMSEPQLHEMTSGPRPAATVNAPVEFVKLTLTMVKSTSGATANTFADSPVPWPLSSSFGFVAAGPSTTGFAR